MYLLNFLNFTHREKLLFYFFFLLSHSFIFQEIKTYLLENEKKTISHCSLIGLELPQWPGPSFFLTLARVRRADPGRNLGLGRQSSLPLAPAWAESRPDQPVPLIPIGRPSGRFGRSKNPAPLGSPQP